MLPGYSVYGDDNTDDCYGHGTHVSGIAGGLTYGVAKNVTLIPGKHLQVQRFWTYQCVTRGKNTFVAMTYH